MKKIMSLFAIMLLSVMAFSQSKIVGRIDADGNTILTASKQECSDKINAASSRKSNKTLTVSEVSFTRMPLGQVCLTGYEKDQNGNIVSGVRIECKTDDDRNLIITPVSKIETVSGREFAAPVVVSSN